MNNAVTLFQEATKQTILGITSSKLLTLEGYDSLYTINGKDDYKASLLAIVAKYDERPDPEAPKKANEPEKTGITVVKLKLVFSDNDTLNEARKKLLEEKKIVEIKEGQTVRINLRKSNEAA